MKTHLRAVVGDTLLNFEELYTILTEIEACLNSRPLTELSSDPEDLEPLTPGHFLIGGQLNSLPEKNFNNDKVSLLKRWSMLKKIAQSFWTRWSTEYITRLQSKNKWRKISKNFRIGELVLIRHENCSPLHWPLGRITETHPGADGLVRCVTVLSKKQKIRRSVNQLVKLPILVESEIQRGEDVETQ